MSGPADRESEEHPGARPPASWDGSSATRFHHAAGSGSDPDHGRSPGRDADPGRDTAPDREQDGGDRGAHGERDGPHGERDGTGDLPGLAAEDDVGGGTDGAGAAHPWIPLPRAAADDRPPPSALASQRHPAHRVRAEGGAPPESPGRAESRALPARPGLADHQVLKALLGAWALAACSAEETQAVEDHLTDCAGCAEEALRLRDAVGLLRPEDSLDLSPQLRSRVLASCLGRRPARIPVPRWAAPYDAETARLDALLHDMAAAEWQAPVLLRWFDGVRSRSRETTVAGVMGHLLAVDGLAATVLDLPDPLGVLAPAGGPTARTEAYWESIVPELGPEVRGPWRRQSRELVRRTSLAGGTAENTPVDYGGQRLPLRDALLDRAFECWVHAGDIAEAIHYPHALPTGEHLALLVDLAVRQLPTVIADRRRAGLAAPVQRLTTAGEPGRTLHLEVEGSGGGHWYVPLDSPGAVASAETAVAHVALDRTEFCQLAAGRVFPLEVAAGQVGDREAIQDVLFATASLSRL